MFKPGVLFSLFIFISSLRIAQDQKPDIFLALLLSSLALLLFCLCINSSLNIYIFFLLVLPLFSPPFTSFLSVSSRFFLALASAVRSRLKCQST